MSAFASWRLGCLRGLAAFFVLVASMAAAAQVSVLATHAQAPSSSRQTTLSFDRDSLAGLTTNDVLLAVVALRGGGTAITAPMGWELVDRQDNGSDLALAVYVHTVGPFATEPASHGWQFSSTRGAIAVIALRGVDTASPIDPDRASAATAADATAITVPPIATRTNGTLHLALASAVGGVNTLAPPSDMTQRIGISTGAGPNGLALAVATATEPIAGAFAATGRTTTASNAALGVGITVAVRPAAGPASPHHLEIRHPSGEGVTCSPSALTVVACADAGCLEQYTGGVSGTLVAAGPGMVVNWPGSAGFSIPAGASSVNVAMQQVTAGTTSLGMTGVYPAPLAATICDFGTPSCTFSASDSGFRFDVPNHFAEQAQTITIAAVRKSDGSSACTPAFAAVAKPVTFRCTYDNPVAGTLSVRVGNNALNAGNHAAMACDGHGRAVMLNFNADGEASTTVQYADVGRVTLSANFVGTGAADAGLSLAGSDDFVAAPSSFAFSDITPAPIIAGANFAATVTALNATGQATPNFGREVGPEGVTLAFARRQPTGSGTSAGSFSGSLGGFSAGMVTASNLSWTEVGSGDLSAALKSGSYLGTGLNASGSTGLAGAVGRFIPHHFTVDVTAGCAPGFTYSGQAFAVRVTARNAAGGVTTNYDGSAFVTPSTHARSVALSDASALGTGEFTAGAAVAASAFRSGAANASPTYAFANKLTAPGTLVVRATNSDGVSSSGHAEGSTVLRSGRLRVANGFGRESAALQLVVQAEYWTGGSWLLNASDSCTVVPASAVALGQYRNHLGAATMAWSTVPSAANIVSGSALLALSAPSPAATGSVALALNLGSTTADQSCTSGLAASTGAALPWLRARNGACAATADRDPAARASFGIYSPETRNTVHARELF